MRYVIVSWRAFLQVSLTKINFGKNSSCFPKFPFYWTSIKNNPPSFPPTKIRFSESLVGGFSPTHFKNMQPSNWIISPETRGEKFPRNSRAPKNCPQDRRFCTAKAKQVTKAISIPWFSVVVLFRVTFSPQKKGWIGNGTFFCLVHLIWQTVESYCEFI